MIVRVCVTMHGTVPVHMTAHVIVHVNVHSP